MDRRKVTYAHCVRQSHVQDLELVGVEDLGQVIRDAQFSQRRLDIHLPGRGDTHVDVMVRMDDRLSGLCTQQAGFFQPPVISDN
jgi:hypothetical protein